MQMVCQYEPHYSVGKRSPDLDRRRRAGPFHHDNDDGDDGDYGDDDGNLDQKVESYQAAIKLIEARPELGEVDMLKV